MNELQHETSPYLLQHAHNPVEWHAWKPAAFEKAARENKPLLVSIGYSTCHWCHVMERESFEDKEVAEFMNDHFVCIKVDREERPDVDQIYMEACQMMNGSGGWPLNCFLMPDGRPFYAGTYYPPMPAHNRPSWLQVLMNVSHAFQNRRDVVEGQADRLTEGIERSGKVFLNNQVKIEGVTNLLDDAVLHKIWQSLNQYSDKRFGGFGGAPKFPGTMSLHYLLDYYYFFGEKAALDHAVFSLDKMIMGGIYDQVGGGFARYATDSRWLVPHFEKMLYDNALLVSLLSEAYKLTKKELYKETIVETLDWVLREMTSGEGGFYAAQDADSEGVEGKFYVWDKKEIEQILGDEAALFCDFYDVSTHGNWEEKNILWRQWTYEEYAAAKGLAVDDMKERLAEARLTLYNIRDKRIHPGLDDKMLLDWNALMCSAFAKAFTATGEETYRQTAVKNLRFMLEKFAGEQAPQMLHTYKGGKAQYDAFLDDYAFLMEAILDVYEITFDISYLLHADRFMGFVLENFLDPTDNLFYFTSAKQKDILLRRKDLYDSATPSGNSTMVRNLQRLGILLGNEGYMKQATEMILTMKEAIEKYPSSFSRWACSLMGEVRGIPEIAVVGEGSEDLALAVAGEFLPQKVLMASTLSDENFPLLMGKGEPGDTLIYMCENFACQKPVKTLGEFRELLSKV